MYASLPTSWNVWDEPIVKQWRLNTVPQISDEFKVVKQRVLATCHPATDVNKVSVIVWHTARPPHSVVELHAPGVSRYDANRRRMNSCMHGCPRYAHCTVPALMCDLHCTLARTCTFDSSVMYLTSSATHTLFSRYRPPVSPPASNCYSASERERSMLYSCCMSVCLTITDMLFQLSQRCKSRLYELHNI